MLNKIDIRSIVCGHFKTLRRLDKDSKKINYLESGLYLFIPLVLSATMVWYKGMQIDKDVASVTISALSIFGGLLFTLPISFYTFSDRMRNELKEIKEDAKRNYPDTITHYNNVLELIKETYYNVSFSILLCISAIITTVFCCFFKESLLNQIFSFLSLFLYIALFITILMIIKRIHMLFKSSL